MEGVEEMEGMEVVRGWGGGVVVVERKKEERFNLLHKKQTHRYINKHP